MRKHFLLFLVLVGCLMLQGQDRPFGPTRLALPSGTTLPTTCAANIEIFVDTDATPAGQQVFLCNSSGNGFNLIGDGGGVPFDPVDEDIFFYRDDFAAMEGVTSGQVGVLNWFRLDIGAAPTLSKVTSVYPNIGIIQIETPATTTQGGSLSLPISNGTFGNLGGNTNWDNKWVFRLNSTADVKMRIGISNSGTTVTPTNTISVRFDSAADTLFTFETCLTSTCTTSTTNSITADTDWHMIRIRSTSSGTILFSIDSGTETSISTNVPTADLTPMWTIVTSTSAAKTIDMDFFAFKFTSLGR